MRSTSLTAALLLTLAGAAAAQDTTRPSPDPAMPAATITVEAVLTSAIVDRQPTDTVTMLAAPAAETMDTVFLWTRVRGAEPGTVLRYVWLRGDEEVGSVDLTIGGSPWRTWSSKVIPADATGAWRVEVRDQAGNVLQSVSFTVGGGM